jgi:hypothetical protein
MTPKQIDGAVDEPMPRRLMMSMAFLFMISGAAIEVYSFGFTSFGWTLGTTVLICAIIGAISAKEIVERAAGTFTFGLFAGLYVSLTIWLASPTWEKGFGVLAVLAGIILALAVILDQDEK